ncbi:MAG: leucyl aminopeptidase, partial [Acidobacteriota bacterium]|nr:leucyl aminopeptidase [Acidobacteriota bacterium]
DMGGAAAVLAAFAAAVRCGVRDRLYALLCLAENAVGPDATRPDDILHMHSGKTVEINNTDAEGRLVLADGIVYANRYKPDAIVDIATLTGAVIIALGGNATAVMGNDDELIERLSAAGERTGERLWQLPTWDSYKEVLKSEVADMKNSAGREAGTIAGAMFLQEFAGKNKWAHLDIAGTAWNEKDKPYAPVGSAGVGVRLLLDFIEHWEA